jgi:hypothetical protein
MKENNQFTAPWTNNEIETLKTLFPSNLPLEEIQKHFPKRSINAIKHKASALGLKRPPLIGENRVPTKEYLELTDIDKGYLAGFLDGEGSIGFTYRKDRHGYTPTVIFSNSDKSVLEWIRNRIGGILTRESRRNPHHKDGYKLYFRSRADILPLLRTLLPHLKVKKKQAELMIQFCESRLNRKVQNSPLTVEELKIIKEVSKLNKRGIRTSS